MTNAHSATITITLNGKSQAVPQQHALTALVESLNLSHKAIAVAINRTIISRANWANHVLQNGDEVDVVRAIGGG